MALTNWRSVVLNKCKTETKVCVTVRIVECCISGLELASSSGLHFLGRKVGVGTRLLQNMKRYVDIGESMMMSMIFVEYLSLEL